MQREYSENLNFYETVFLMVHGYDEDGPLLSPRLYVKAVAPTDYELAIDEALSSLSEMHRQIARLFYSSGLSFLEVARVYGVTKNQVNYAVRVAKRAFDENKFSICVGPKAAEEVNKQLLPIELLCLCRESLGALKSAGIISIRKLLSTDPAKLSYIPRISSVREREIHDSVKEFLLKNNTCVPVNEKWKSYLEA